MLAATANMYNGHEPNSNQNGANSTITCSGCQLLSREIEELKRMLFVIMDIKPDINATNLYNNLHLFGQHPVPQQPYPDSPLGMSSSQSIPSSLIRTLVDRYIQQQSSNGFQLPMTPNQHDVRFWQAANAASASTSSSSNRDLAPHTTLVDMEVDNKFNDRGPNGVEGSGTSSSTSSSTNILTIPQPTDTRTTPSLNHGNIDLLSMFSNDKMFSINMAQRAAAVAPLLNLGNVPDARFVAAIAAAQDQVKNKISHQTPCSVPMQMPTGLITPTLQLRSSVRVPVEKLGTMSGGSERKKSNQDDFIKTLRNKVLSNEEAKNLKIPVPEAFKFDKNFRPITEEQVIQQLKTNKKFEYMDPADAMIQLCKKMAEKRVFGTKLMAETTVAAPNHSNYANLPEDGIMYILHVCRKTLLHLLKDEDKFFDAFRDSMKKLAARCRRVRHSRKVINKRNLKQENLSFSAQNPCSKTKALLGVETELSPSIFANAQALAGDNEQSSRSSTTSNANLTSSLVGTRASPETPPSLAVTPSSSHTSPMALPCSSSSPSFT